MKINQIFLLSLLLISMMSCSDNQKKRQNSEIELPYYSEATYTPEWIEEGDSKLDSVHTIADFSFVNQNGDTVSNQTFEDKIYVTNFFFSICPNVCPRMTKNLDLIQQEFKDDDRVKLLSHTVMPWVDSVGRLAEFGQLYHINSQQWHLVTGSKEEIYSMARTSYFADEGFGKSVTSDEDFLHTENIILIDQKRRIRGIYNGTIKLDMLRAIDDIRTLLK